MIVLLSPAKTLDFHTAAPIEQHTKPQFHTDANRLAAVLQGYSPKRLAKLMSVSPALAEKTSGFYKHWKKRYDSRGAKQALLAYQGDVYGGLKAGELSGKDFEIAQRYLRILSGLYGLLCPLDLIQPYRLEMGTRLATGAGQDLYQYWGDRITQAINEALAGHRERVVVNLASAEYFKAIDRRRLDARVITATFKEEKDGQLRFLTVFGKQARGLMARHIIRKRITRAADLAAFREEGYRLAASLSDDDQLVFTRKQR